MARNVLVDAGFVVALLSSRDNHHEWAVSQASELPPPWSTCEAVLSESFHFPEARQRSVGQRYGDGLSLRFPGSPTIRVNGRDVEPQGESAAFGLMCCLYSDGSGAPCEQRLRAAIEKAGSGSVQARKVVTVASVLFGPSDSVSLNR
jgi:hypothetical protein